MGSSIPLYIRSTIKRNDIISKNLLFQKKVKKGRQVHAPYKMVF